MEESWAGSQGSFDMVCVFSGVIEDLTDRTKQSSTYDEPSDRLVRFVEVALIMLTWNPDLRGCKNRCAGRWVRGWVGHVSMQKRLHKGGATRLRDSTSITTFLVPPLLIRVRFYTRAYTMVWKLRARCRRATHTLFRALSMRLYSVMSCAGRRQLSAARRSECSLA